MRFDLATSFFTFGVKRAPPYLPPLNPSARVLYLVRSLHLSTPPMTSSFDQSSFTGRCELCEYLSVLKSAMGSQDSGDHHVIDSCLATTGACLNVRRLAQLLHAAMADPKGRFASMRHAKALMRLTLVQFLIALTSTGGARNHE